MMTVYCVGPFEFDPSSRRLFRGKHHIRLSGPEAAILLALLARAGQVVSKQELADAGWGHVIVSDNSLKQTVYRLRKKLGSAGGPAVYIETASSEGYRFVAPVARGERVHVDTPRNAALATHQAFVQGRADLYTLNRDKIARARAAFDEMLRHDPGSVPAHIGLANTCALAFEATRVDAVCDLASLQRALHHGREATTRWPRSGDAWSAHSLALNLHGDFADSRAAASMATALEPDDWHHWLRLAYVSWGEERIRAARRVLALFSDLALAYWLIATVLIARGAYAAALDVLCEGCRAQDAQSHETGSFTAVGLHLLRALVLAAQGHLEEAARELTCELSCIGYGLGRRSLGEGGHVFARECAATTWYALGAIRLRQGRLEEAQSAFANALAAGPGHLHSAAALGRPLPDLIPGDPRALGAALARAVGLARAGRHADAARVYRGAVTAATLPSAGWILPVEPLIDASSHPDIWAETLAIVRHRAV